MMSAQIGVAFYEMTPGEFDWRSILPAQVELSWEELTSILTTADASDCTEATCAGKKCPHKMRSGEEGAWSPVVLEGTRSNDNVQAITALVLDGDAITPAALEQVAARVEGKAFIVHTTHRHRDNAIFIRLILQLSRPVLPSEWPTFYPQAIAHLGLNGIFDSTCKDLSRIYYLPTHPSDVCFRYDAGQGEPLDVEEILASAPAPSAEVAVVEDYTSEIDAQAEDYVDLGKTIAQLGAYRRSRSRGTPEDKDRAALIGRLLDGAPLAAPGGNAEPTPITPPENLPKGRGYAIMRAARICTTYLPTNVPDEAYLEIFRRSIDAMCFGRLADREEMEEHLLAKLVLGRERRAEFDAESQARRQSLQTALARESRPERSPLPGVTETPAPVTDDAWLSKLQTTKDGEGLQANGFNAYLLIKNSSELRGHFRWNDVSMEIEATGGLFEGVEPEVFDVALADHLTEKWGLTFRASEVYRRLLRVAYENRYDPLRDFLRSLTWDGVDRITANGGWLTVYANAQPEEVYADYVRDVGQKWLVSAVARALAPGSQADLVLILKGDQGRRKSSLLRELGGDFYADMAVSLAEKDAKQIIGRAWICELPDLASLKKSSEINAVKAFFSTVEDTYRPPYARTPIKSKRRNVFAGTTNDDEFLIDPTGNRRYMPVRIERVDYAGIIRDRDQLWAQAVVLYDRHVQKCENKLECGCWWFTGEEKSKSVEMITTQYMHDSPFEAGIYEWWDALSPDKRPKWVTTNQIAKEALSFTQDRVTHSVTQIIGPALKKMGFKKTRRIEGDRYVSAYVASEALLIRPQSDKGKALFRPVVLQGGKGKDEKDEKKDDKK